MNIFPRTALCGILLAAVAVAATGCNGHKILQKPSSITREIDLRDQNYVFDYCVYFLDLNLHLPIIFANRDKKRIETGWRVAQLGPMAEETLRYKVDLWFEIPKGGLYPKVYVKALQEVNTNFALPDDLRLAKWGKRTRRLDLEEEILKNIVLMLNTNREREIYGEEYKPMEEWFGLDAMPEDTHSR